MGVILRALAYVIKIFILFSLLHKDHEKRAPYKCERCAFATHSPLWLKRHVQRVHDKVSEIRLYDKFLILIRFMKFESFDKN